MTAFRGRCVDLTAALSIVLALLLSDVALGALIYLKGESEPLAGFVEASDDVSIDLRIESSEGEPQRRRILRSEIDVLLQPVNAQRLEQLSPDNPAAYREYAEELVEKRSDPEAVDTALRLFIIAAHLDPAGQARSALLGMTPLARDPQQVRQWKAMAYLRDKRHDVSLLQPGADTGRSESTLTPELRKDLRELLGHLRRGQRGQAKQMLQRDDLQNAMRSAVSTITLGECRELIEGTCAGCQGGEVPAYLLQKLVTAELELDSTSASRPLPAQWGLYTAPQFLRPLPALSLEKATPYDPRKSVYRNGQWVEP